MTQSATWTLQPNRCFSHLPDQRKLARNLYEHVKDLPLVCPHGHVPPQLLADPNATLGNPAELFVIPDHYILRMLYSRGVSLEDLGVPTKDDSPFETDGRKIWQRFAEHFYLFVGTPTGLWLKDELVTLFGITTKLNGDTASAIHDELTAKLAEPEYSPRALFERFNIETLCTTDAATDTLETHQSLHADGWTQIRPTFRPDAVVNLDTEGWLETLHKLSEVSSVEVTDYASFINALEQRRAFFKGLGAVATDHAAVTPHTERLSKFEAEAIFQRALAGILGPADAAKFTAHMLLEMARMSVEDGLVMQLHAGSFRNHNRDILTRFGRDMGADIPVRTEWTRSLFELLNAYGNEPDLHLILFTLDETGYSRELAPLAGHYPALRLGPPWWFFDSVKGMERFLDNVVETAGIYNLAGFNDDTRAFASIPSRHDVWRRVTCNWLAGETLKGLLDEEDALAAAQSLAYGLAKEAYKLEPHM
ncbi:glucuronate isomerase [soil metagenome]